MGHRARLKHEKLAIRLAQSRLSQNTWARRLGISKGYLSQMVHGKRLYPGDEVRNRLLQLLQAPFHEFFELESEDQPSPPKTTPLLDWRHGRIRVRIEQLEPPPIVSGGHMIHDTMQDIRLGWRSTWKNPGISLAIILLLALGIGANSTIYSLVHASLLTPLPFPDSRQLVAIAEADLSEPGSPKPVSPAVFRDWQERARSFSGIAAFHISKVILSGSGEPEQLDVGLVSPEYFSVLGLTPLAGRLFTAGESQSGDDRVVLISERFWRERLAGDSDVTTRSLRLGGEPARIVGVVPATAGIDQPVDLWLPLIFDFDLEKSRGAHYLSVLGRLAPETTLGAARAEMGNLADQMAREYPLNREEGVHLQPLLDSIVGNARVSLLVLWGAVALILGIACVNAANLILSRSASRLREVALRRALGASSYRLWRQFIVESLQLSLLGGMLGVALAAASLPLVLRLIPTAYPRLQGASLNPNVLLFTLAATLLTGFLFGLAPALNARKKDAWGELREGTGAIAGASLSRLRSLLLIAQVSLAVVLVMGASLLVRTLIQLSSVDPGFNPEQVLTVELGLPENRYSEERAAQFYADLQTRLAALPGVTHAGATAFLPLGGAWTFSFDIVGRAAFPDGRKPSGVFRPVLGDYFASLGIELLKGRNFDSRDRSGSPLVVLINQALAGSFFPDIDPIGQQLAIGYGAGEIRPREIVGVVSDIRQWGLAANPFPAFYLPHAQVPFRTMNLVLKTAGPPLEWAPQAKARIWELDPELAPAQISTLESRITGQTANTRFRAFLVGSFAGLALLLALFGTYGVISHWVFERTPEIGLRMALGADPQRVFQSVLKRGGILALSGLILGSAASVLVLRLISGLLFQVSSTDAPTYFVVCFSVLVMALAASALPAFRATRIDPVEALRGK